jgi:hypothetical protein
MAGARRKGRLVGECCLTTIRPIAACAFAFSLAACAGPQVRTVGTGGEAPAYELRGSSMQAIEAEAARLCGKGYTVLRQAQRFARPEGEDNAGTRWLVDAGDWLAGTPGNQAQATVQCRV